MNIIELCYFRSTNMSVKIHQLRFNQDVTFFTCATETGVSVYSVTPLTESLHLGPQTAGSIVICEMGFRGQMIGIVSGGNRSQRPANTIRFFDVQKKRFIGEGKFESPVKALRLKNNKLVISLAKKLFVYAFPSMRELLNMELRDNSKGLLEITPMYNSPRDIVIVPACKTGAIQILDITSVKKARSKAPVIIECHENELSCIALNREANKVATASEQGTIIRVWSTITKEKLIELRRGCEAAQIYSLAFSPNSDFLCCSSDKGTVHIFSIANVKLNKNMLFGNLLGKFGGPLKSFLSFQLPPECPCVCGFSSNDTVVAVGTDGSFNKYKFNEGGHCTREEYDVFLDVHGDKFFK